MAELIITEKQNITAIADAVRNKTGKTDTMTLGDIAVEISNIGSESGDGDSGTSSTTGTVTVTYSNSGSDHLIFTGIKPDKTLLTQEDLQALSFKILCPSVLTLRVPEGSTSKIETNKGTSSVQPGNFLVVNRYREGWLNKNQYGDGMYDEVHLVLDTGAHIRIQYKSK